MPLTWLKYTRILPSFTFRVFSVVVVALFLSNNRNVDFWVRIADACIWTRNNNNRNRGNPKRSPTDDDVWWKYIFFQYIKYRTTYDPITSIIRWKIRKKKKIEFESVLNKCSSAETNLTSTPNDFIILIYTQWDRTTWHITALTFDTDFLLTIVASDI